MKAIHTGKQGEYLGSPAYRELDARKEDMLRTINQHRKDEKEAAVHDNDSERAIELRRQVAADEKHLESLNKQMRDQKREDLYTLVRWERLGFFSYPQREELKRNRRNNSPCLVPSLPAHQLEAKAPWP